MTRPGALTGSTTKREWRVRPSIPPEVRRSLSSYPDLLAQLLYNRGIREAGQAERFLSSETVSHDPLLLPDMEKAVERLTQAMRRKERTAIFGDFDVDGITATALLARALGGLGLPVTPYIPHRVEEGHGLSLKAVQQLADDGVTLLITVDCGITSHREIEAAIERGIDTIVTDHHLAPPTLPSACAVVDHRIPGSLYPFPHLTGAGLALKLAQALYQSTAQEQPSDLFALAALGTIADVAPLLDENRSIVQQGLAELRNTTSPGLRALIRSAGVEKGDLDTEAVSWALAPRLNAPGRLDHAMASYQLLMEESEEQALSLATVLERWNRERRRLTDSAMQRARELLEEESKEGAEPEALLMVADSSFLPGIVGLLAGRLSEEHYRPAVAISTDEEMSRGSCRSIPEFDIGSALYQVAAEGVPFHRHGGHPRAAGFTIATENLSDLRHRLTQVAEEKLSGKELRPRWDIDVALPLGSLPRESYRLIQALAPFGEENPLPLFLSPRVQVADVRTMGGKGEHLRLKLRDQGVTWDAVAFRQDLSTLSGVREIDVVYTIGLDRWGREPTLRLTVMEFRPSE